MRFRYERTNLGEFEIYDHSQGSTSPPMRTHPIAVVWDADLAEEIVGILEVFDRIRISENIGRTKQYTRRE